MQAVTVNVGTGSAVKLVGIGSVIGGAGSQNVKIRNDGPTNSLFIGGSSAVTSGNGFAVPVGTTVDLGNLDPLTDVWAIAVTAAVNAQILAR
jgi:hypothetical protein